MTDRHRNPSAHAEYLVRAGLAAFSLFLPNVRVFIELVILGTAFSPTVRAAVGLGGSVSAILTVLASGFVVTTIRACAQTTEPDAGDSAKFRTALGRQLAYATIAALILLVAAGFCVPVMGGDAGVRRILGCYLLAAVPGIALAPFVFVLNGAFQCLHRDASNFGAASVGTVFQASLAIILVAFSAPPMVAAAILGAGVSATALVGILLRAGALRRAGALAVSDARAALRDAVRVPRQVLAALAESVSTSVDGLVFMLTFSAAIAISASYSADDGAQVALAVSFMRAVIVPLKQFGLVGARLVLRDRGRDRALTFRGVQASSLVLLAAVAGILVIGHLTTGVLGDVSWVVVLMMAGQLFIEPWAGVCYSYRKIVRSGYAGLVALAIAYAGVAGIGLTVVLLRQSGSAVVTWGVLLAARLVFALALHAPEPFRRARPAPRAGRTSA